MNTQPSATGINVKRAQMGHHKAGATHVLPILIGFLCAFPEAIEHGKDVMLHARIEGRKLWFLREQVHGPVG